MTQFEIEAAFALMHAQEGASHARMPSHAFLSSPRTRTSSSPLKRQKTHPTASCAQSTWVIPDLQTIRPGLKD